MKLREKFPPDDQNFPDSGMTRQGSTISEAVMIAG
jgi:hypothetical protein